MTLLAWTLLLFKDCISSLMWLILDGEPLSLPCFPLCSSTSKTVHSLSCILLYLPHFSKNHAHYSIQTRTCRIYLFSSTSFTLLDQIPANVYPNSTLDKYSFPTWRFNALCITVSPLEIDWKVTHVPFRHAHSRINIASSSTLSHPKHSNSTILA